MKPCHCCSLDYARPCGPLTELQQEMRKMGRTRLRHWRQLELDAYELLAELLEQHCKHREASGQDSLRHLQQASCNACTCTVPVSAEVLEQQKVADWWLRLS